MEAPKRIYLQTGFENLEEPEYYTWNDLDEVTWCVDCINDSDIECVRQDVAAGLRKALETLREGCGVPYYKELLVETAWLVEETESHALTDGKLHDGISTTGQWEEGEL